MWKAFDIITSPHPDFMLIFKCSFFCYQFVDNTSDGPNIDFIVEFASIEELWSTIAFRAMGIFS